MAKKKGKDMKVALGSDKVLGMGTWNLSGITSDQLEITEFGDDWKKFMFGLKDGGQISFNGLYDPDDVSGQDALRAANLNETDVTTLRLYIDNTSYFEPCQTTGYWSPSDTTGNPTVLSYVNITAYDISGDKSGLGQCSFTAKMSGCMVLV